MPDMLTAGDEPRERQPWSAIVLKIALIVVALFVSFWITASAVDLTIFAAYKRYVDSFSQVTRLDPYLANVVLLLFFVPFFFGVKSYLFSLKRRKRRMGLAVLVALAAIYNITLYFSTRNQYFVGANTKYYALVPGRVEFSARP